ncbi:hypothetical protein F4680DRAFT_451583 [Xylaria scruposa]|nr:hypothetical protein F4680DRAFT_451583 [Xylaria scruposa]
MPNIVDEADTNFHHEVINQLVDSMGCAEHLESSVRRFLSDITTNVKHKDLAYHLFLTVTLYISKKVVLDEEQMSAICRTVEQLKQEWGNEGASSELSNSYTRVPEQDDTHPNPLGVAPSLRTEPEAAITPTVSNATEGDIGSVCDVLERVQFSRSITPDSFVRGAEKHVLVAPTFHGAMQPKDTADLSSQYPYGYKLMRKQGWSNQSGLGPDGSGIQRPIDADAMAHCFGDNESSAGVGFASKSSSKVPTNGISAGKPEEQTNEFAGEVSPWRQYAADPYTGDKSAKDSYENNAISKTQRNRVLQRATIGTNGNTNTTDQDHCVIRDTWVDTSKHEGSHHAQKNATPHGSSLGAVKAPPKNTNVFVPCASTKGGGW